MYLGGGGKAGPTIRGPVHRVAESPPKVHLALVVPVAVDAADSAGTERPDRPRHRARAARRIGVPLRPATINCTGIGVRDRQEEQEWRPRGTIGL